MGLGTLYYKWIDRPYYKDVPLGLLILNWIIQRVFGINKAYKYSVNYTSRINGASNLNIIGGKSKLSLIVSGGCYFSCHKAGITIGENTIFANNVTVVSNNHDLYDKDKYIAKPVVIGNECWLGAGVTILPGVTLGNNVVVGANSVVTKSFPKNMIVAGNPAKVIKTL